MELHNFLLYCLQKLLIIFPHMALFFLSFLLSIKLVILSVLWGFCLMPLSGSASSLLSKVINIRHEKSRSCISLCVSINCLGGLILLPLTRTHSTYVNQRLISITIKLLSFLINFISSRVSKMGVSVSDEKENEKSNKIFLLKHDADVKEMCCKSHLREEILILARFSRRGEF